MGETTIKLHDETKLALDTFREYKNESYDEVVTKLVTVARACKSQPELAQETIVAIEKARERIKREQFVTAKDARKRLRL